MRVLVVEDDPKMAAAIRRGLRSAGIVTDLVANGEDAQWMVHAVDLDVDVLLPGGDGFETCQALRQAGV